MYRIKTIMKRMAVGANIGTGIFPCGNVTDGTCGTQHREAACLKCGSKMKRVIS
jgi:hypothetical protein